MSSQLLDQFGNPIRKQQLTKLQAEPGITGVRNAFAHSVASGLTPVRLAQILLAANDGDLDAYLVLAEEMEERDPHYSSVLGVRKRAVSGITPIVKPASEDKKDVDIAKAVEQHIAEHSGFSDLVEDMLDALGKGFSAIEIDWKKTAQEWTPQEFIYRDPRFFKFDRDTGRELRLIDEADMVDGIALEPFKFISHRAKIKSGLAARGGLARLAAFTWMCKSYAMKDWVAFVETYGLPLRLGRYGPEATGDDVEKLFMAVANIGTDAAAVLPKGMDIDFEETNAGTGNDIFEKLARWGDEQISKGVLGQTMTSDNGSSQAQANVHNDVRHDIAVSDAKSISGTLNRDLVKPYVDLNYGIQDRYPIIQIIAEEPEDLDMIMQNVDRMAGRGVKFKQSEVRQRLGFSEPDKDDEIFGEVASAPSDNKTKTALNRENADDTRSDALDDLEDELNGDWEEILNDAIDPIEKIITSANSYEEALANLASAFPEMSSAAMIEGLVKASFKARSLGDVSDG